MKRGQHREGDVVQWWNDGIEGVGDAILGEPSIRGHECLAWRIISYDEGRWQLGEENSSSSYFPWDEFDNNHHPHPDPEAVWTDYCAWRLTR